MYEDGEEVLDGPRLPRWVLPAGALVAAVLVAGLVVKLSGNDANTPAASRSSPATSAGSSAGAPSSGAAFSGAVLEPSAQPVEPGVLGPDVATTGLPVAGVISDVVTDGSTVWFAAGGSLIRQAGTSTRVGAPQDGATVALRLALDPNDPVLWAYDVSAARPVIGAYDSRTLTQLSSWTWPDPVQGAAVLDGRLYVATGSELWALSARGLRGERVLSGVRIESIAADPSRDRVLMVVNAGPEPQLATFDNHGRLSFEPAPIALIDGRLTVTASGQIWLGGAGANGAIVDRLDPRNLDVRAPADVITLLGERPTVFRGGSDALLVGGASGQLWCVDGASGVTLQRWPVPATSAAIATGRGYATTERQAFRLRLRGECTG